MQKLPLALIFTLILLSVIFFQVPRVAAVTWLPEIRFTTNSSTDQQPCVFEADNGSTWVVWDRPSPNGQFLVAKTSADYGVSWSSESNLTAFTSFDVNIDPFMIQLSNGTMMLVWSAMKFLPPPPDFSMTASPSYLTVPQGGSNTSTITVTSIGGFSDVVDLKVRSIRPASTTIHTNLNPSQVTPPPNGNANSTLSITVDAATIPQEYTIVVTGNNTIPLNVTNSVTVMLNVTATEGVSSKSSVDVAPLQALAVDSGEDSGENHEIYYRLSNDNGTTWSGDIRLTDNSTADLSPVALQASNGTIWVAWGSNRNGNFDIFYKTYNGSSWSQDRQLTSYLTLDQYPTIAQMADGRIWIAWHSDRYSSGGLEIMYKIYNGTSWTADTRFTDTAKDIDDTQPALLQTTDGTIWMFWASEGLEQPPYIFYKQSFNNGGSWSGTLEFTTGLTLLDESPAATQTRDGKIWVMFVSMRDGNLELYHKNSMVHNVATANASSLQFVAYQEEIVTISVKVQNRGDYNESVTVTCYANLTSLGSQYLFMNPRTSAYVVFLWDTSTSSRGNYFVKAIVDAVENETYLGDNNHSNGPVRVKLLGDFDDNGVVNNLDLAAVSEAYGSTPMTSGWEEEADMNGDYIVNAVDLFLLGNSYGHTG